MYIFPANKILNFVYVRIYLPVEHGIRASLDYPDSYSANNCQRGRRQLRKTLQADIRTVC